MIHRTLLVVFLPTVLAQSPLSPALPAPHEPRVPIHTRPAQPGDVPYGIWAAGTGYKVGFAGGMEFIPYLGKAYPHNQSFAWRTTSVRCGGRDLLEPGNGKAAVLATSDHRAEYRLGGVIEAYDVLGHGLEQTFVIAQRPAVADDLVVTGAVTTRLRAATVAEAHVALAFVDADGRPILTYGCATAVDADGDTWPMTTSWDGAHLALRLPAAAVAAADFPLTVDPLLTPMQVSWAPAGKVIDDLDVSCSPVTGFGALVAWTAHASATDGDVFAYMGPSNLGNLNLVFSDTSTGGHATGVSAAWVAGSDRHILVYQNHVVGTEQRQFRVHLHQNGSIASDFTSLARLMPLGIHDWRPDVGGTGGGTSTEALIVFQRDTTLPSTAFAETTGSEVMGLLFDTAGNGRWGAPFAIHSGASSDVERPSVNPQADGGSAFSWIVCCQAYNNTISGDDWDLVGRSVDQAGQVAGGAWFSDTGNRHQLGPVVSGRSGRYLVAFSTAPTSVGRTATVAGTDLRVERFDWAHGDLLPTGNQPNVVLQSNLSRVFEAAAVALDTHSMSHWTVAARAVAPATPAVIVCRTGYRGQPLEGPTVARSNAAGVGGITTFYADVLRLPWFAYSVTEPANGNPVYRQAMSYPNVASTSDVGSRCGTTSLAWTGPAPVISGRDQLIGSDLVGPAVQGAPADAVHFLVLSLAAANLPIVDPIFVPGCSAQVAISGPDYLGFLPIAIGAAAAWRLPLPETLLSDTIYLQDFVLAPATNRFHATEGMAVPIAR